MTTPTSLDFYRFNLPRGENLLFSTKWDTTGVKKILIIPTNNAISSQLIFIKKVNFLIEEETEFSSQFFQIGKNTNLFKIPATLPNLLSLCSSIKNIEINNTKYCFCTIDFLTPLRLSIISKEVFEISLEPLINLKKGSIIWTVLGWIILEENF